MKIFTVHGFWRKFLQKYQQVYLKINICIRFEISWCNCNASLLALFGSLLSKYQCRFSRSYSKQHCLISLIEKWKKSVDNSSTFDVLLLTNLLKAFNCLPHELLILKLDAYGFDECTEKRLQELLGCIFLGAHTIQTVPKYCNWTRTQNHLALKWTLNHLAKQAKWSSCVLSTYLYGAFDCIQNIQSKAPYR